MKNPKVFLIDVDGVLTTGQFLYTENGKTMKMFGPDDHDGLSLLKPYIEIQFLTGDKSGYNISKKRVVDDMKFPLEVVSTVKRTEWISEHYDLDEVIYMGDGIFDHYVFKKIGYAIAPANADIVAKKHANSLKSLETDLNYLSEEAKSSLETFKKLEKHQEEEFEVYLDKFVNDI